jgi:hypothetical protein
VEKWLKKEAPREKEVEKPEGRPEQAADVKAVGVEQDTVTERQH